MESDEGLALKDLGEGGSTYPTTSASIAAREAAAAAPDPRGLRAGSRSGASDIEQLHRRVFSQADLSAYSSKERFLIRGADLLFYFLIRSIGATMRWEAHGSEHLNAIHDSGHRAIFTFWHTCIFMGTWFWRKRGIVVMSSQSRDAQFTSRFIKRF